MREQVEKVVERVKRLDIYWENWLAWLVVLGLIVAAAYVLCIGRADNNVTTGFSDTKRELRDVGDSVAAISGRIGNSEGIAETIGAGVDGSYGRVERLGGSLQRVKAGTGEIKGGVSEIKKRIILAENLVHESLIRVSQSRKILAGYREKVSAGEKKD